MAAITDSFLREQLLDRRRRLEVALPEAGQAQYLVNLLQEVDSALERMDKGTFGLCEACHDTIEADRLMADPLIRLCLGHLTPEQQRALEQDLELASQIQARLLPRQDLRFDGWEICYHYQPAGPVSGDFCDVLTPDGKESGLLFLLGDVSGKGVAASMLTAHLHAMFRSLIGFGLPVGGLMERANRLFCENTLSTHYATLVCGRTSGSGDVELCNAGHCPVLVIHGREVTSIGSAGLPVGMFSESRYSVRKVRLAPGDSLLLYTDGLIEARNGDSAEYGTERLMRQVADCQAASAREMIAACLDDCATFRSGTPVADDLTAMAIRRL